MLALGIERERRREIIFGLITNPKGCGAFYTIKPPSYGNIGSQFVLSFWSYVKMSSATVALSGLVPLPLLITCRKIIRMTCSQRIEK